MGIGGRVKCVEKRRVSGGNKGKGVRDENKGEVLRVGEELRVGIRGMG